MAQLVNQPLSMFKALGSIPSTSREEKRNTQEKQPTKHFWSFES